MPFFQLFVFGMLLLSAAMLAKTQTGNIAGKVTDASRNLALVGAVQIDGQSIQAVTDESDIF